MVLDRRTTSTPREAKRAAARWTRLQWPRMALRAERAMGLLDSGRKDGGEPATAEGRRTGGGVWADPGQGPTRKY